MREPQDVTALLADRGVAPVEWSGWMLLDAYEQALGAPQGRTRIKVVPREEMLSVARGEL
jgi:ferredoxin--NADP+ reductase